MITYVTNRNGHMKFLKKILKYEISKGANPFGSEPNTDVYLPAFTALKRATELPLNLR